MSSHSFSDLNKQLETIKAQKLEKCEKQAEIQTVNVVNTVRIKRTKCLDKILQFIQLDEHECKSKQERTRKQQCLHYFIIWLIFVFLVAVTSACFIMWFTNYYETTLQSNLVLANNTKAKQWWEKTPIYPLLKVYIFNYTNTEEFLSGQDDILRIQEIGPLTYNETGERVELEHHDDNTISYRERKHYELIPELSNVDLSKPVIVPNVLSIIADTKVGQLNVFEKIMPKLVLRPSISPFKTLNATEFLWGYDDPILHLQKLQSFISGDTSIKVDKLFGIIRTKNGTSLDKYRINTGENDISKLGVIVSFNDNERLEHYKVDSCNEINGTDGSQFPPHLVADKSDLHIFINTLCRKFPLVFEKEVTVFNGIPALRYKNPENVFSHPDENPDNRCYCEGGDCPPSGLFDLSKCIFDMPILASFPHFYQGNESLWKNFDGIRPEKEKHETYADIHGKLAFPLSGVSRFQINIKLPKKTEFPNDFAQFHNPRRNHTYDILPLVWMEITGGDIPIEFQEIIYHSTFTVNVFESNVRYGTVIIIIVSFLLFLTLFFVCKRRPEPEMEVTYIHETVHIS